MKAPSTKPLTPLSLPTSSLIEWSEPKRRLDAVSLPPGVREQVSEFLREQSALALLAEYGLAPRRSALLHGPTGTGKTSLAEAIATQLGRPLGLVKASRIVASYLGASAQNIDQVFSEVAGKRVVIFLDELDAIGSVRGDGDSSCDKAHTGIVTALLLALERIAAGTVVLAATNRHDMIDPAIIRRMDLLIEMPAPSREHLLAFARWLASSNKRIPVDPEAIELGENYATAERAVQTAQRRWVLTRGRQTPKTAPNRKD